PGQPPRAATAIGDQVVDLNYLHETGFLDDCALPSGIFAKSSLNDFLALGREGIRAVRGRLSDLLRRGNDTLLPSRESFLHPMERVEMLLPVAVGDYTDFYSSE